jgi:hypothetical protein
MPDLTKHQGPLRRKPYRKRIVLRVVLDAVFHWHNDTPEELAKRVNMLRHLALRRRFTEHEWCELDKMRDRMRANAKFQQAIREAHRVRSTRVTVGAGTVRGDSDRY